MKQIVFFMMLFLLGAAAPDRAREANSAYERGDYVAAEQAYRDAINQNPGDSRLHFNLGNALAKQGKTEEAVQAYERFQSLARTPEERALADYNLGNLLAQNEQWEEASEQFRRSLRQNPNDEDAASNYEYVRRQLEQSPPPQQQDQDQQSSEQDDGAGEPEQGQPQQGENGDGDGSAQPEGADDQQDEGDGSDQQDSGEGEQEQQLQQVPQPQPGDMTQQEAEQLLNAISSREQDLIRDFLRDLAEPGSPAEKDW